MSVRWRRSVARVMFVAVVSPGIWMASPAAADRVPPSAVTTETAVPRTTVRLQMPLTFEANAGQFDEEVRFVARGRGYTAFFTDAGATITLQQPTRPGQITGDRPGSVLRISFEQAQPRVPSGLKKSPGVANYLIGNDSSLWHTNVPMFDSIRYENARPGVDLVYYGGAAGVLECDLIVAPGADASSLAMHIDGADRMESDAAGNLVLTTEAGALTMAAPATYQIIGGERRTVESGYARVDTDTVRFALGPYDESHAVVIDPQLIYGTYMGGSGNGVDQSNGVAVDSAGSPYIVGSTETTDFPKKGALQTSRRGQADAVVTKLTPDGLQLVYSTYLGGGGYDYGTKIAVTPGGIAYVLGDAGSADFPLKNPAQPKLGGQSDAFVVVLNAAGSAITQGTFLGGSANEIAGGIQLGTGVLDGLLFVNGTTHSSNFPTKSPTQTSLSGASDGFVTVYERQTLKPSFSTYAGPAGDEQAVQLVLNTARGDLYMGVRPSDGTVFVIVHLGPVAATPIRTWSLTQIKEIRQVGTASVSNRHEESNIATILMLEVDLARFYPARSRATVSPFEGLRGLTLVGAGCVNVSPATTCNDRASLTNYDQDLRLLGSLNFGGAATGRQFIPTRGLLDTQGHLQLIGQTSDNALPVVSPVQATYQGSAEGFVMTLDPATGVPSFLSYLGGSSFDTLADLAVDTAGNRWIVGETQSSDFPVTRSGVQPTLHGRIDGFVVKITP